MHPQQQQQMSYPGVGPSVSPAVIYVPVAVQSKSYDSYAGRQSIGLGTAQVVVGVLCAVCNVVILATDDADDGLGRVGHGFWCGALFIINGSLGIAAGARKQKCQIVGFMVLCIITALSTISLLTIACIGASTTASYDCGYCGYDYSRYYFPYYLPPCRKLDNYSVVVAMEALMGALAIIEAVLAIWGSVLCCRSRVPCCCCSDGPETTTVAIPTNLPFNGQMIYLNQPPPGELGAYVQYPLGMIEPPTYFNNYVQPSCWTASVPLNPPPPHLGLRPPAFTSETLNQGLPAYSSFGEGSHINTNDPVKF